jgi:predicted O-linked N-acetylglucosamine transferase (SPINDLY family)
MSDPTLEQAMSLHRSGNLAEAARLYGAVLAADPRHFQALYLLGFVHYQAGRYDEAERLIGDATRLNPYQADAYYNRGCALQKLRRDEEAIACFDQALALKRDYGEAHFNRGTSLLNLGQNAEALAGFDAALRLAPSDAEAWHNRGTALQGLKRFAEALKSYERALALAPHLPFAMGKRIFCKLQICDWAGLAENRTALDAAVRAGHPATGPLEHMLIADSPADHLVSARLSVERDCPMAAEPLWRGERYAHERIRIAYLSSDFHGHAVAYQLAGVIERHDERRFETFALSHGPDDGSAIRARLARSFEHFIDMRGRSDFSGAAWLKENEIDIAVDLSGHTLGSRLSILAQRPVPLQVSYLGYPGTTGAPYVDYLIADRVVIPETERMHYSEKIALLPHSFFPTDAARAIGGPPTRPAAGLPQSGFVFCCFNPLCKLGPESFAIWMRLLRATSGSVLWLPEPPAETRANLAAAARAHGIAPERLVFAPFTATADDHLARLQLADLFLDTWPYNAHATASDALWMGVPVVTMAGKSFAARVAASLLHALHMPELVTDTPAGYEATALRLAQQPKLLLELRERLKRHRAGAPLFDTGRYTAHLEQAYEMMWQRWRREEPPADFTVAA